MKTIYYQLGEPTGLDGRYAATIGVFDGVHRGHRFVIESLGQKARERGLQTMVVTFLRHPRQVVQPEWQPQLLTTLEQKTALLAATGIDVLVVLRFDEPMARLSARDFMARVLGQDLHVSMLLTGYDNRFGHDRSEGFAQYVEYGREMGLEVVQSVPYEADGQRFSSSLVRRLLAEGNVALAARCLGRNYQLSGRVVHGHAIGRTLGFPTANIVPCDSAQIVPRFGVYCVMIRPESSGSSVPGVMNIGMRPTFGGQHATLEAYLLDFEGNLYDQVLTVEFLARLRSEQQFASPDELVAQMKRDAGEARKIIQEYEESY